jgi:hypothetical protein
MVNSSKTMLAMVNLVGERVAMVMPKIARRHIAIPPQVAKQVKRWTHTQRKLWVRFFERHDYRHSSEEFKHIAELAQWLATMHTEMSNIDRRKNGMPVEPIPQLTFREDVMIKKTRTYG